MPRELRTELEAMIATGHCNWHTAIDIALTGVAPVFADSSLRAFWKFEESSGNRIDSTGNGHDLVPDGPVLRVAGHLGFAAEFGYSTDDYLDVTAPSSLAGSIGSFYIAFWFFTNATSDDHTLFYFGVGDGLTFEYKAAFHDAGIIFSVNSSDDLIASDDTSPGDWHFIEFWFDEDAGEIGCCVDAGTPATAVCASITAIPGSAMRVGDRIPFDGGPLVSLDAMGFWGRMLTAAERLELWNSGVGSEYPETLSLHLSSGEIFINRFGISRQYLAKLRNIQALEMSVEPEVDQITFDAANVDMVIGQTLTGAERRLDGARAHVGTIFIDRDDTNVAAGQHIYDAKMSGELVAGEVADENVGFTLLSDIDAVVISGRTIASEFQWREPVSVAPLRDPRDLGGDDDSPRRRGRYGEEILPLNAY